MRKFYGLHADYAIFYIEFTPSLYLLCKSLWTTLGLCNFYIEFTPSLYLFYGPHADYGNFYIEFAPSYICYVKVFRKIHMLP